MAQEARLVPAALLAAEPDSAAKPLPSSLASVPAAAADADKQGSACSPLASAMKIRVTKESDFIKRTRHPPSTTVVLELQTHLTLKRGLLFGPTYACTVLRSGGGAKGRGYRLYVHRMSQPFRAYSPACPKEIPDVGTDVICPLIHVYRSYGVQIVKVSPLIASTKGNKSCEQQALAAAYVLLWAFPSSSLCLYTSALSLPPPPRPTQGYTFGRVDIIRTMHSRIDSMKMTGVSDFKRGNGVIRVMLSGYGPLLVRSYIYITNNEVYGAYMPVLLHVGTVGAVVRNNYVHDFVFAGITCGNMVHSQGDCLLSTISNNPRCSSRAEPLPPPYFLPSPIPPFPLCSVAPSSLSGRMHAQHHLEQPRGSSRADPLQPHHPPSSSLAPFPSFLLPTSQGDCMLSTISNNLVVAAGRNLTGGFDATGIYFVTHWINPEHVVMKSTPGWNRIEHVVMTGTEGTPGWNRIQHVVMKGTEGTPGWCACITATICNCLKDPGNYWDRMRAKYYGTAAFQQDLGNYWDRMQATCYSSAAFQQRSFAMRRYLLPLFARFVNFATRLVDALSGFLFLPPLATRLLQWLLPLEERAVLRAAYKATGLRDYGEGTFLTGLRLLLKGLEEEARLSAFGRILIWNDVQRLLRYRLQLEDTRRRHPEIEAEKIEAPVFILGLPRTGTTFLFNLLALDTSLFRSPLTWEVHHMHPPPDATCYDTGKRIGETEAFLEGVSALLPSFQALHPVTATGPQECMGLMMYDFTSFAFPTIHFNIPSYFRWYLSSDLTPTYRLLRWQLQYLQWRGPKAPRWLLKCPAHLFSLPSLMAAFPDAKLIFTHRNPLTVLASAHSLIRGVRSIHSDHVDKSEISQTWVPAVASALAEMMRLRGIDGAGTEVKGGEGEVTEAKERTNGSKGYVTVTKGEAKGEGDEVEGSVSSIVSNGSKSNGSSPIGVSRSSTSNGSSSGDSGDGSNEFSSIRSADVLLALQSSQAVDVCYSDLVADPMATVRRIYRDLLKRQLDDDVADKMRAYLAANSKEKRPGHHYKWEDTMLDKQAEKQRFEFYIRAFGLESEQ
ncbi:unnamed protein product [Closterium sp. Naga37s-1]|nr:unnamed protein product [Closterium sp. Naga37s-1]